MSLNSWKKEFYQGRLRDAAKTAETATIHSIRKWKGLRRANLDKHLLDNTARGVITNMLTRADFEIDASTCALCAYSEDDYGFSHCGRCPFTAAHHKSCCDGDDSPYMIWMDTRNPEPMIEALERTLAHVRAAKRGQHS